MIREFARGKYLAHSKSQTHLEISILAARRRANKCAINLFLFENFNAYLTKKIDLFSFTTIALTVPISKSMNSLNFQKHLVTNSYRLYRLVPLDL